MSDVIAVNRPIVAVRAKRTPFGAAGLMLGVMGLAVFMWLSEARAAQESRDQSLPPLASSTGAPAPALPATQGLPPPVAAPPATGFFIPKSGPVALVASSPATFPRSGYSSPRSPSTDPMRERLHAPALVVDLAQTDIPRAPGSAEIRSDSGRADNGAMLASQATGPVGPSAPAPSPANDRNLSDTERFSARVGNEDVQVAQAQRIGGLDRLVPQGAVIGAVMETALNSDLPGFARAMVQRDVYSFDGSAVLIPAGSRLIGQYKSGVAQGASRVFVLWTRLIRPDGVSIELASPAVDDLGRGGIGGKVNRHFLQRFGGAILTSVLSAGINAAAASLSGGSTIIVGSAGQASSLASQATQSADIPPTITTKQGAAVRIFVARDLDFTRVGPTP